MERTVERFEGQERRGTPFDCAAHGVPMDRHARGRSDLPPRSGTGQDEPLSRFPNSHCNLFFRLRGTDAFGHHAWRPEFSIEVPYDVA
jgi:hypothetical protein